MMTIHPEILERLISAKKITLLTGAGLSAESGIPTFRDAQNSLWSNTDPMAVASIEGFRQYPEKVWAWHEEMRRLFSAATPNPGHNGIALLEMLLQPAKVHVITQNIDGFHQEAGSSWVLDIHGTAKQIICSRKCGFIASWTDDSPRNCPVYGNPTRPNVVWFGEALNEMLFELAEEKCRTADVFIAVGTSGVVQPAAGLALLAANSGAITIEVNPGETPFSQFAKHSIRSTATDFFQALCKNVRAKRLRQLR